MSDNTARISHFDREQIVPLAIFGALTAALVLAYGNTLYFAAQSWSQPQYSLGYLVPLFTLVALYLRYQPLPAQVYGSARWSGVVLLALGLGLRPLATYPQIISLDMVSF